MKSRSLLIAAFILILAFGAYFIFHTDSPANTELKAGTVVAFGDSLVQGVGATEGHDFISLLGARIGRPIINLGHSGDSTAAALERIEDVTALNPQFVIILLGGNDYIRKIPIKETFSNLDKIIDTLKQHGAKVLLLGVRGGLLKDNYKSDFAAFAKKKQVLFVPNVLDGLIGNGKLMSDGIHPNDAGYILVADKVEPKLVQLLR